MTQQKRFIPNPNKISDTEQKFISPQESSVNIIEEHSSKGKYKGRMISMSDSFYEQLNTYLKENPTEGNRSSFIVRVVAEYMSKKT